MRATGTFRVESFNAVALESPIETALPVGVATMVKAYEGEVSGRSATIFTSAFDQARGVGTYVAMESFEGHWTDRPARSTSRTRRAPAGPTGRTSTS